MIIIFACLFIVLVLCFIILLFTFIIEVDYSYLWVFCCLKIAINSDYLFILIVFSLNSTLPIILLPCFLSIIIFFSHSVLSFIEVVHFRQILLKDYWGPINTFYFIAEVLSLSVLIDSYSFQFLTALHSATLLVSPYLFAFLIGGNWLTLQEYGFGIHTYYLLSRVSNWRTSIIARISRLPIDSEPVILITYCAIN